MSVPIVGIDIGGTKIAAGTVTDTVRPLRKIPTPQTARGIVEAVALLISEEAGPDRPVAVGIGSAGAFDAEGRVASATDLLPGWSGLALATLIRDATGLPTIAVNDVHAAAVCETRWGAARGHDCVLVAAVGTGLGGAAVIEGELVRGPRGLAGSLGHIMTQGPARRCSCGVAGHAESLASGPGMARLYAERTGMSLALPEVAARAAQGDADASWAIETGAMALGDALATGSALVDPEVIVVGGGVAALGEMLLAPARRAYQARCLPPQRDVPIVLAEWGSSAAIIGAALLARDVLTRERV